MSADPSKRTLPEHLATLQRDGEQNPRGLNADDVCAWLADVNAAVLRLLELQIVPRQRHAP